METIGEKIDKLSICNIKMNQWNTEKFSLHNKLELMNIKICCCPIVGMGGVGCNNAPPMPCGASCHLIPQRPCHRYHMDDFNCKICPDNLAQKYIETVYQIVKISSEKDKLKTLQEIADLDIKVKVTNEQRVQLKNEINQELDKAIKSGTYKVIQEKRTYKV